MNKYRLSNVAKEDLIRIHNYGVHQFGKVQADKNFVKVRKTNILIHSLDILILLPNGHSHLKLLTILNLVIDDVFVDLTAFITK